MPGHTVTIEGLMISDSNAGGIHNDHATLTVSNCVVFHNQGGNGGGIYNDAFYQESATLTIVNSIVDTNCACYAGGGFGGGIYSDGTLTIVSTTVSNNFALTPPPEALGSGGGIYNSGPLTITGSTITRNFAGRWGGGIAGSGTITSSTVDSNTAGGPSNPENRPGVGGGIFGGGTISNSTISGNTAWGSDFKGPGWGGGVYSAGATSITNSTISSNSASNGGSIYNSAAVEIGDTILNAGAPENIYGGAISNGYNISSDDGGGNLNGPGDQINTDPLLGPLQDNGGPTFTHALLPGSPAINAGDPNFTPPPFYDQRGPGFDRVVSGRIDIGSFEVQIQLQAAGRRVQGKHVVDLSWIGTSAANIDIYRDGALIVTVPNNGTYTDQIGARGKGTYTYKVCEAGTQNCSNEVTVRFGGPTL
jgi:hypothetical protein